MFSYPVSFAIAVRSSTFAERLTTLGLSPVAVRMPLTWSHCMWCAVDGLRGSGYLLRIAVEVGCGTRVLRDRELHRTAIGSRRRGPKVVGGTHTPIRSNM